MLSVTPSLRSDQPTSSLVVICVAAFNVRTRNSPTLPKSQQFDQVRSAHPESWGASSIQVAQDPSRRLAYGGRHAAQISNSKFPEAKEPPSSTGARNVFDEGLGA